MDQGGAAISLRGASKTYGSGPAAVTALRGTDLDIEPGEFVVILGPSGSGKTTLLNLLGAIDTPTAGRLLVGGVDLGELDGDTRIAYRRSTVGFVFQFFNLIPTLTARENVELVAELTGAAAGARATAALERVGLSDRLDHFPGQLSGGEQQRVAIARAIVKRPQLMLCDEPTGELDVETGRRILEVLLRLNRDDGSTLLVVTHNAAIAEVADRVVRLRSGSVHSDVHNPSPAPISELAW